MSETELLYLIIGMCAGYILFPISALIFILALMRWIDKPINTALKEIRSKTLDKIQ